MSFYIRYFCCCLKVIEESTLGLSAKQHYLRAALEFLAGITIGVFGVLRLNTNGIN
jgi:hypothetical protein